MCIVHGLLVLGGTPLAELKLGPCKVGASLLKIGAMMEFMCEKSFLYYLRYPFVIDAYLQFKLALSDVDG
jgi:hypothetical protein